MNKGWVRYYRHYAMVSIFYLHFVDSRLIDFSVYVNLHNGAQGHYNKGLAVKSVFSWLKGKTCWDPAFFWTKSCQYISEVQAKSKCIWTYWTRRIFCIHSLWINSTFLAAEHIIMYISNNIYKQIYKWHMLMCYFQITCRPLYMWSSI